MCDNSPKIIKRIHINDTMWIDITEVTRGSRVIGKNAWLCQGLSDNFTEISLSKFDIESTIKALNKAKKEIL